MPTLTGSTTCALVSPHLLHVPANESPHRDAVLQSQVREAYADSLRAIWWFGSGLALVIIIAGWIMRPLPLREWVDSDHGLRDRVAAVGQEK